MKLRFLFLIIEKYRNTKEILRKSLFKTYAELPKIVNDNYNGTNEFQAVRDHFTIPLPQDEDENDEFEEFLKTHAEL